MHPGCQIIDDGQNATAGNIAFKQLGLAGIAHGYSSLPYIGSQRHNKLSYETYYGEKKKSYY